MPVMFYIVMTFTVVSVFPDPKLIFSPYISDIENLQLVVSEYKVLALLIYTVWFIILICLKGTKGPNKYGLDPLGANDPPPQEQPTDKEQ